MSSQALLLEEQRILHFGGKFCGIKYVNSNMSVKCSVNFKIQLQQVWLCWGVFGLALVWLHVDIISRLYVYLIIYLTIWIKIRGWYIHFTLHFCSAHLLDQRLCTPEPRLISQRHFRLLCRVRLVLILLMHSNACWTISH